MLKVEVEGNNIHDIPSFYDEINRIFMQNEDWKLGNSLDALDDMLYGAYSIIQDCKEWEWIWLDVSKAQDALGYETTQKYYQEKLQSPSIFNQAYFIKKLQDLEEGNGQTYFEIVDEILASHTNIKVNRT